MSKRNKIIYWVATLWLSLGMVSTGIVQVLQVKTETDFILQMGYPSYLLSLLGITKLLGVIAILVPKFPLVKEWVYAGFTFMMLGAIYSHLYLQHSFGESFPPVLLLLLTATSYYFRPESRKMVFNK